MTKLRAIITGVNGYLPDYKLTNEELSKMVDTSDEWIMQRIGIKERRIQKGEGLATSDMGAEAVKGLLEKTGTDPKDIDLIIVSTITPDMFFPSTANPGQTAMLFRHYSRQNPYYNMPKQVLEE